MSPRRIPQLGFVGVGWIGRHRMGSLLKSGLAEAAAVFDQSPQAMAEACKLATEARRVRSYEEMLDLDLDGVVIATPNVHHAGQCIQALEKDLHVFCQKPLGRNAEEVREIVRVARKRDRLLGVDLSYRHLDAVRVIKDQISAGEIGEVFAMDMAFHNAYGPDKAWFFDPELSGGGCFLDLGIHLVDLLLWVHGWPEVASVTGRLYSQGRPMRQRDQSVEDYALARLDLEGGATANITCSWRISAGCDSIIGATFHGTKGSLRLQNVNGSFYDFRAERLQGTHARALVEPPEDWSGRAIVGWAHQMRRAPQFDAEAQRHVDVMEVMDRVYAS